MNNTRTIERILLTAAMLGTVVSVFSAGQWFALWTGSPYSGFALAVVVDVGMFAAILASRRDRAALWIVAALATVSWAANAQHALLVHNGGTVAGTAEWTALDLVTLLNALVVTAVAPVAALALAMLYHRSATRGADIPGGSVVTVGVEPSSGWEWPPIPATPPTAAPQPRTAAPAPKAALTPKRAAGKATGAPDTSWHPEALELLADGLAGAEVARRVGKDASQISRLKARALNGAGGGA